MGFIVDKKLFLKSLASVMPAVRARSTLPILSGIKLGGADTRFSLEATDLELVIRLQGPAKGTGEAVDWAVVPAKALAKAVKSLSGNELTVDLVGQDERPVVEISSGKRRVAIDALPASDWPEIGSDIEFQAVCWFEARELADALRRVVLCASEDEARPVLTGVQFNFRGDSLELVATDSYRLGVLSIGVEPMKQAPDWAPIVPAKALKALAKQLKREDGRGILYVGKSGSEDNPQRFVEFSFGTCDCWLMREISGEFPNWRQIVPEESGSVFEFASEEMAEAVKGAAALRSQKSVPVRISLGDSCELRMEENGTASVAEALSDASYFPNGVGPISIAFSPTFLLDAISFVGEEKVRMRATDPLKPALFLGENGGRYVLMPVRLPR
jgi:DNA polymerase-3 subunit beta